MLATTLMATREDSVWILIPGLVPHLPVKYMVSNVSYYLNGNKRRQCLDMGSWSGTTSTCQISGCLVC